MKNLNKYIGIFILLFVFTSSCQEDDVEVGAITSPTNLSISGEVVGQDTDNPDGDGSGFVDISAEAENVISYKFDFGDGTSQVEPSGTVRHRFTKVGVNTFTVIVNAIGTGGISSSTSMEVTVRSDFDDPEAKQFLTGGSSRIWYLAAAEPAHLGLGPANASIDGEGYWYPKWYTAGPFEKCEAEISACFCDDELTFTLEDNGDLTYQLNNNGSTFFNGGNQAIVGGDGSEDACFEFDTSGTSLVSLAPTSNDWSTVPDPDFSARGTSMSFSDDAFMSYYLGTSDYEIISLTDTELLVRTLDVNDSAIAWYLKFQTSPAEDTFETVFNDLVWSDEFDTDGAPDATKWTHELGAGGWGNQELQTYTDDIENSYVSDGTLKITAKANGSGYTSARLITKGLQEFTYGRVEVRAKLPAQAGTWPAIWMLGANFDTVGWPASGEIDIMEQTGWAKEEVSGTLHYPGHSAGDGPTASTSVETSTTAFHNYSVEWTTDAIKIMVDDKVYNAFDNTASTPFNLDFFMILNVAMGGTLGGDIDPGFIEDTMEVEYIRIYQ
ncbi:family 16 glycosylhydrolase [Tamlana sp. 2_MG-2023]|uniref:family 16 glycosylhydrolase n=1 Tax=unclassified Tamlana TaxID=2614803 RepID=UPI0026E187C6|nr:MULTISPECIES: family 16 glycosylhydrolase [unclassified Tamlana]MDO6759676.1 family 16 glycosylhydrolase [Tamlana sp. 2_MG-2023]MDO6791299.1 family 16 glycosylhydrolase [Tamlana sp. 1_MG-2023]